MLMKTNNQYLINSPLPGIRPSEGDDDSAASGGFLLFVGGVYFLCHANHYNLLTYDLFRVYSK